MHIGNMVAFKPAVALDSDCRGFCGVMTCISVLALFEALHLRLLLKDCCYQQGTCTLLRDLQNHLQVNSSVRLALWLQQTCGLLHLVVMSGAAASWHLRVC